MIFAMRKTGHHQTLVEFLDWSSFKSARECTSGNIDRQVSTEFAFRWVRSGKEHETGLHWINDQIAYASPENQI